MQEPSKPDARPLFRRLAFGVAILCFGLAAAFRFVMPEQGIFGPVICFFVGAVMVVIGATGKWPPKRK